MLGGASHAKVLSRALSLTRLRKLHECTSGNCGGDVMWFGDVAWCGNGWL